MLHRDQQEKNLIPLILSIELSALAKKKNEEVGLPPNMLRVKLIKNNSRLQNFFFIISPIQGQKQNSQQRSSCVKRNPRKTPAKSPEILTPPDTPLAINLDDGKLKKKW